MTCKFTQIPFLLHVLSIPFGAAIGTSYKTSHSGILFRKDFSKFDTALHLATRNHPDKNFLFIIQHYLIITCNKWPVISGIPNYLPSHSLLTTH